MAGNKADRFFVRTPGDIAQTRDRLSRIAPPAPRNDLSVAPPSRQVFPWWIEKPNEAQDFSRNDFAVALPAGVGATATSANIRFQVPQGMVAVIQNFGIYVVNQAATTSVQFDLQVNGVTIPGWSRQNAPGIANIFLENFNDLRVRLLQSGVINILFTNLNAFGPWVVGGTVAGWFMSQTGVQRLGGDQY
jgi:hypothetical protein